MTMVLVAEDDLDIRNLIVIGLRLQGYEVVEAYDGQDALEKARCHPADILLMDIRMPRMDGFALCAALKEDVKLRDLPIVILSARLDQEEVQRCHTLGVDALIQKPFEFSMLHSAIGKCLDATKTGRCL